MLYCHHQIHFLWEAGDADCVYHPGSLFPGFHTMHTILGVRCLPLHNLLHYIDHGVLLLTEAAVTRLMKGKPSEFASSQPQQPQGCLCGYATVWSLQVLPHSEGSTHSLMFCLQSIAEGGLHDSTAGPTENSLFPVTILGPLALQGLLNPHTTIRLLSVHEST